MGLRQKETFQILQQISNVIKLLGIFILKPSQKKNSLFYRFRQAKYAYGSSILSSNHFLLLFQLPQKMKFASIVVKTDQKIIISLPKIKIRETHNSFFPDHNEISLFKGNSLQTFVSAKKAFGKISSGRRKYCKS